MMSVAPKFGVLDFSGEPKKMEQRFRRDRCFFLVLVLSAAVVLFNVLYILVNPPLDGDSYEYAGVARNFLRYGKLVATHISGYFLPEKALPHPAWNRATLWTFIIMPFQALFGNSVWSFAAPYQITLFLVGPAVYLFARRLFSRSVALAAAVATIFTPRLINFSTQEDPGIPDTFAIVLFIAAIHFFIGRRWFLSGVFGGVLSLIRITGLILPVFFALWALVFERKLFKEKAVYLYFLATLLFSSPLFIRNAVVFGNPFYSDQSASTRGSGAEVLNFLENYSTIEFTFSYSPQPAAAPSPQQNRVINRMKFIYWMSRMTLLGTLNGVSYYPGFFELLTFVLFPFFLVGAWQSRLNPARLMTFLFIGFYLFSFVAVKMGYEDRYLFPVLPFSIMLAFFGAETLSTRFKRLSVGSVLFLFLLVEAAPSFALRVMEFTGAHGRSRYNELIGICDWIKRETPPTAVLMTTPFWSPQYFCDRYTVPAVFGNLESFKAAAGDYGVDYFLFTEYWGGDRLPRFNFMQPLSRGKYLSLFEVDRANPDFLDLNHRYGYMKNFNYLDYFWQSRIDFQIDPPIVKILIYFAKNMILGAVIFILLCLLVIWLAFLLKGWRLYVFSCGLFAAMMALKFGSLILISEKVNLTPPQISRYQADHFFSLSHKAERIKAIKLAFQSNRRPPDSDIENLVDIFSSHARGVSTAVVPPYPPPANGEALFIPVAEAYCPISDYKSAERSREFVQQEKKEILDTVSTINRLGYEAEILSGGVLCIP